MNALRERIMTYFESDMIDEEFRIPFTAQEVIGRDPSSDAYLVRRIYCRGTHDTCAIDP